MLADLGAGVAAPMVKLPSAFWVMPMMPGICLVSTISSGLMRPERSWTSRSVPPDMTRVGPVAAASSLTASLTVVGAT